MSLGPVFYVEMLTVGRRRRYVLTRILYGLLLLVVMGLCYTTVFNRWSVPDLRQQAQFAFGFFMAFSWVQLIGVLFLAPAMVAGTIAGEHERRTIDYLLTTSLGDVEITLGKFVARMLAITAQLAAGIPILAIAMTLGGISPEQLFNSFGITLLTLLSVGGLCLALSARARTSREAIVRAYIVIVFLLLAPPALWAIIVEMYGTANTDALRVLTEFNPVYYLGITLVDRQIGQITFGQFAAFHLTAAVLSAATAVYSLRRFYVKQAGLSPPKSKATKEKRRNPWSLIEPYSMMWKEITAGRNAIRLGWFGKLAALALYALALWGLGRAVWEQFDSYGYRDEQAPHAFGTVAVPMIASLSLLLVAGRAAGSITAERERDTWLTLISTPLTGREIVWAKFSAAIYSVRYWYLVIALGWLLCIAVTPKFAWAVPLLMIVHLMALSITAAIGVLCSLASKTSLRAMGATLAILVLVLSIGPLFIAAITRSEEFTGFALPVTLGSAHYLLWEMTDGSLGGHEEGMAVSAFIATMLYGAAAVAVYASSVTHFDAFTGRTVPLLPETTDDELRARDLSSVADAAPTLPSEPPAEAEQST